MFAEGCAIELITDVLLLRELREDDFEAVHAYTSNPDNVKYVTWGPYDKQGTKSFIEKCLERQNASPRTSYDLAITLKETGQLIGSCGVHLNDEMRQAVMGWILHIDYWMKGYMTEALKALLKFGFEDLKLHRMYAWCNTENYSTYRVMEKCGMRREATFLESRHGRPEIDKEWIDEHMYALLAEEWQITAMISQLQ